MLKFKSVRPIVARLLASGATIAAALTINALPVKAQGDPNLTNEQRWKILDCYNDMAWDSSACRKLGVEKRGAFFHGPLGTNDPDGADFNGELDELLTDCRGVNDGYCAGPNEDTDANIQDNRPLHEAPAPRIEPTKKVNPLAPITRPVVCRFDSAILYGPYSTAQGDYRLFRFQLRGDGMAIVNGRLVKPLEVDLKGESSTAQFPVGSIDVNARGAAMSQGLSSEQLDGFNRMMELAGIQRSGGIPRFIEVYFSDHSVIFRSIKDGEEIDTVSDRCE